MMEARFKFSLAALLFLLLSACVTNSKESELGYGGAKGNIFGYVTVENAIDSLTQLPGASKRKNMGWTVIAIESDRSVWSFPPKEHPAFPSAVKRQVIQDTNRIYIETKVSCGATKNICDGLVEDFIKLNDNVQKALDSR